jgi:flavin reductase (DIM6/NTAB) family NADH-FMN oxidoreductase RutF
MKDEVYPSQAILVTMRGKAELLGKEMVRDSIITLAWHCPLSFEPKLYGISVGRNRFSHRLISESRVFAVNFVSHDMKEKVIACGTTTGASVDKFQKFGIIKEECGAIDCPCIKEAAAILECEVIDRFDTGDHTFFVGKVLAEKSNNDRKRLLYMGSQKFSSTL